MLGLVALGFVAAERMSELIALVINIASEDMKPRGAETKGTELWTRMERKKTKEGVVISLLHKLFVGISVLDTSEDIHCYTDGFRITC